MESDDDPYPVPERVIFDVPRALTQGERALLDGLVRHMPIPELAAQAATARVVGGCSCGCPSIVLEVDGPAVPEDVVVAYEPVGRDDYLLVDGMAPNASGHRVNIDLHVLGGRIDEMEIWAAWDGTTSQVTDIPAADGLEFDSK